MQSKISLRNKKFNKYIPWNIHINFLISQLYIYIYIYIYEQDLPLSNHQVLIYH